MKKIYFLMLAAAMAFASCVKEASPGGDGKEVAVRINAAASGIMSRATMDAPAGLKYYLEVYHNGKKYGSYEPNTKGQFDIRLVSGQPYKIVCWADFDKGYYNTTDLTKISIVGVQYDGNDDKRDAFYGVANVELDAGKTITVEMKRPFGQVNIRATDLDRALNDISLEKGQVSIAYSSIPTEFNALTGAISGEKSMKFNMVKFGKASDNKQAGDAGADWVSFDYIFAPADDQALYDFALTFYTSAGAVVTTNDQFKSVPVKRNYRTNVYGNLLTKGATIKFEFLDWDGAFSQEIVEFQTITALNADLKNAATNTNAFVITSPAVSTDANATVIIPDGVNAATHESLSFSFPGGVATGTTLTIKDENHANADNNYNGPVYLSVASGTTVTINLPNATVYLNGTKVANVTTTTAQNTFVVAKDSQITGTLTVAKGNVEIYGSVANIERAANNPDDKTIVWLFDGAAQPACADASKIEFRKVASGQIKIGTKSFSTLKEAVAAAAAGSVIELSTGDYPLTVDPIKVAANQDEYLRISKNLTVRGVGEVNIFGQTVISGGNWHSQSTIFIDNGASVKFENLTFMPHVNTLPYGAKTIEVIDGSTVEAVNCEFVANTKVAGQTTAGGSLYLSQSTAKVTGCTFQKAAMSVDGLMSGAVTVDNSTFDAGFISTVNWGSNDVTKSAMSITVTNSQFKNTTGAQVAEERLVRAAFGTIYLTNCTFPSNVKNYWQAAGNGSVIVNGKEYLAAIVNVNKGVSYETIEAAIAAAASGDVIKLSSGVHAGSVLNSDPYYTNTLIIDKAITLKSNDVAKLSGIIVLQAEGIVLDGVNYSYTGKNTIYGNIFVNADNVTIKNSTLYADFDLNNCVHSSGDGRNRGGEFGFIRPSGKSGLKLLANTIQTNAMGIFGGNMVNATIDANTFKNLSGYTTRRVWLNDAAMNNVVITNNIIDNRHMVLGGNATISANRFINLGANGTGKSAFYFWSAFTGSISNNAYLQIGDAAALATGETGVSIPSIN